MSAPAPREVLITGLGLVSAAGQSVQAHAQALGSPSAPTPLAGFDASGMPVQVAYQAGKIKPQPYMLRRKDLKLMSRDAQLAVLAAGLAMEDAGYAPMQPEGWPTPPEEIGLYMGAGLEPGQITELSGVMADCAPKGRVELARLGGHSIDLIPPLSSLKTLPNMALAHVSINLGLMGPGESLSPWGSAGLLALGVAAEAIARGECEVALVGAADSDVDLGGVTSHARLDYLAALEAGQAARALEPLEGQVLGEGACFFVLESREHAAARGARVLARVAGADCSMPRAPEVAFFSVEGLSPLARSLGGAPRGGDLWVMGAAGHSEAWRRAEEVALTGALGAQGWSMQRASDAVGSCVAASGLLDLGVGLAAALSAGERAPGALLGLAWGLSGQWAAARLELEGGAP